MSDDEDFSIVLTMSDYDAGSYLVRRALQYQAEKLGIPLEALSFDIAQQIIQRMAFAESQDIEDAGLEKALKKAVSGDMQTAGRWIKNHLESGALHIAALDEAVTGRRRQRARAKRSRTDPLSALIAEIVQAKPEINEKQLLEELRSREGGEIIEEITEREIFYIKEGHGGYPAALSGLKHRLSRTKKKLGSR